MFIFAPANRKGEVLEWLKRRVWKARDLPKGFAGSNPALSAESRGCHQPRLFASTAGSPFLFFLERGIIFISCAFASMVVPSPPPSVLCTGTRPSFSMSQSAQEDPRHLLSPPTRRETPSKRVPTRAGGPRTTLHSSYASGNPLQACSDSHRRTAGALALLLCRPYLSVDPPPNVFDPFRGAGSPPKTSGGPRTTLQSSYAQGNPLQACSDPRRRNVGALALLLCRWKPLPSVF